MARKSDGYKNEKSEPKAFEKAERGKKAAAPKPRGKKK